VPDDLEIPADLLDLQRSYEAAQVAVTTYHNQVREQRAQQYPNPIVRGLQTWDEEQAALRNEWSPEERAELERLQAERNAAQKALWAHPAVAEALKSGGWKVLHEALKREAGAEGWGGKPAS
jgi:hypothetical protein